MATDFCGYMGRVLRIDLGKRIAGEYPWSDSEREMYPGGRIMALKILRDCLNQGEDSPVIISTGPLTGTGAPASLRYEITAVSPKDGKSASTNCGGDFGLMLKKAGYDAAVICGKAPEPVWLEINSEEVSFHDAAPLWGMKATMCRERIRSLMDKDEASCLCIGPAGEKLIHSAAVVGESRAMGRSGIGAVLGEKKLKAIAAWGDKKIPIADEEKTKAIRKEWFEHLYKHPITGGGQKGGCAGCPINCGRKEKSFKLPGLELTAEQARKIALELDEVGIDSMGAAKALSGKKSFDDIMEAISSLDFPLVSEGKKQAGIHRRSVGGKALAEYFGIEDEEAFAKLYKTLGNAASAFGMCLFTVNGLEFERDKPELHHIEMIKAAVGMEMDMEKFLRIGEEE